MVGDLGSVLEQGWGPPGPLLLLCGACWSHLEVGTTGPGP